MGSDLGEGWTDTAAISMNIEPEVGLSGMRGADRGVPRDSRYARSQRVKAMKKGGCKAKGTRKGTLSESNTAKWCSELN